MILVEPLEDSNSYFKLNLKKIGFSFGDNDHQSILQSLITNITNFYDVYDLSNDLILHTLNEILSANVFVTKIKINSILRDTEIDIMFGKSSVLVWIDETNNYYCDVR